jgi:protein-S-isoprenylcysteine O-methyltransferase Ste14
MILSIIIWSAWLISEILLNRLFLSGNTDKSGQDKGSLRFIWIAIASAISLGVLCSVFLRFPIGRIPFIPYLGLLIILAGMVFRFMAILTLGKMFTVDVTIRDNHRIKKDGLYKTLRHPSYTGMILSFIGFGVSLNNWISLIIITILVVSVMLYRIKIEEKLLTDHFGSDYLEYSKKTYRLVPWIY